VPDVVVSGIIVSPVAPPSRLNVWPVPVWAVSTRSLGSSRRLPSRFEVLIFTDGFLMPHAHIGWPATLIGAAGTLFALTSLRASRSAQRDHSQRHALLLLLIFLLAVLFLASAGIRSLINSHNVDPVSDAGIAAISLLALGIDRSWELVGGRTTGVTGLISHQIIRHSQSSSLGEARDLQPHSPTTTQSRPPLADTPPDTSTASESDADTPSGFSRDQSTPARGGEVACVS
jgi:hypothetical protein